ncbi:uncharacterized protein F5891DRAFT_986469 [Suillus fuscotomentosus]|uniref:Uncharacterized protein n=1 Tax=Suillus fuscotomentosus TaxID=1912939 RepID=A0AAD4HCN7_9AGAM|nr:uncharacterized protein F5891DRAFT_986469 [Suillus fuscotomentosus]KAG1891840.1 hypothetical protein F5891DRAFT_986469 [Suillus fuscotomentosus]
MSLPTPIHKFPICVTEAIAMTALADLQYFGLDPTIHMCIADCHGTHLSLAVGAKGLVVNNNVCYHVRDPTDGKDYVMKDCWVPEAKRYHEVAILNPNNFIIYEGNSYFIDFDHAGFIEEGKMSTISFGTGTISYISMRVLKKMLRNAETIKKTADATQLQQIEHYMCDDLESMFYIFFEFVMKYGGARGVVAPTWDKLAMPWSEAYENLGASGLLTTFLSKKGAISKGDFLMDRVSNYFLEFKPLVNEWHGQIHLTEIDTNATIIHDHIFEMLVTFIAKLKDSDEIPIPIPLPYPPPQSPTVQPTAVTADNIARCLPRRGLDVLPMLKTTQHLVDKAQDRIAVLAAMQHSFKKLEKR